MKVIRYTLLLSTALASIGCAVDIKPWEKGIIAKPEMAFSTDALESKIGDHIYFAKEATGSGAEVSGGGCGCN